MASNPLTAQRPECIPSVPELNGHAAVRFGESLTYLDLGIYPIYSWFSGLTVFAVVANVSVAADASATFLISQGDHLCGNQRSAAS